MKSVSIDNKIYNFPESWKEVNIKQFQLLQKVDEENELDKLTHICSILGNISVDVLESISYVELNKLYALITFVKENVGDKIYFTTKIKGVEYALDYEWKSMKAKTYIDLDSLMKDKDEVINNLHLIAAILFRKVTKKDKKKYHIEDYDYTLLEENGEFMKENLMVDQLLPVLFFFSNLSLNLLMTTLDSSQEQSKIILNKSLMNKLKRLVKGGVGCLRFIRWLRTILK